MMLVHKPRQSSLILNKSQTIWKIKWGIFDNGQGNKGQHYHKDNYYDNNGYKDR